MTILEGTLIFIVLALCIYLVVSVVCRHRSLRDYLKRKRRRENCYHFFHQSSLTCTRRGFYPKEVEETCSGCGKKRMVDNKYMSCCGRAKRVNAICSYCGKI